MPAPPRALRAVPPLRRPFDATVVLPGSKSLTNRALACAALAPGTSRLRGALFAEDTLAMAGCVASLGAAVELDAAAAEMTVTSSGALAEHVCALDARQSGTTGRFVLPLAGLGAAEVTVDGDAQLRARPFAPLLDAVRRLGATVDERGEPGRLPVVVRGPLSGGHVELPGDVSSQFLSALMLAAPRTALGIDLEVTTPLVSASYVDMTAAVMAAFGVGGVARRGDHVTVAPAAYRAASYAVEPDASAASYFFAAAAITGGRVVVPGLGAGSTQGDVAFVDVLEQMGAEVRRSPESTEVRGTGVLHGVDVDLADCSDTAPTVAAVAVFADSPTRVRGVGFIRYKESDRIGTVVAELARAGIVTEEHDDGFTVHPGRPAPTRFQPRDDHRMAMSFALLGLVAEGIEIADPGCVAKTFPDYFDRLEALRRS